MDMAPAQPVMATAGRGDLYAVNFCAVAAISSRSPGVGLPRQPQRVAVVARDHVQMEVEDGLPGLLPARIEQVHAVRVETFLHALQP